MRYTQPLRLLLNHSRTTAVSRSSRSAFPAVGATTSSSWSSPQAIASVSTSRFFSSLGGTARGFPQYNIGGEEAMLGCKVIIPQFKQGTSGGFSVDRKGRILIELTPRGPTGGMLWNSQFRYGLSVEEVALLAESMSDKPVEITRQAGDGATNDWVDKVFTTTPMEGGMVKFTIDFKKDGVGGQEMPEQAGHGAVSGPIAVTASPGEVAVLKNLFQYSVPHISGFHHTLSLACDFTLANVGRMGVGRPSSGSDSSIDSPF